VADHGGVPSGLSESVFLFFGDVLADAIDVLADCLCCIYALVSNSYSALFAAGNSAPETCADFSIMSDAETFYMRAQSVEGCAISDEPSTSNRYR